MRIGDMGFLSYPSKFSRLWFRPCRVLDVHPDLEGSVRTVTVGFRPRRGPAAKAGEDYIPTTLESMLVPVQRVTIMLPVEEQSPGRDVEKAREPVGPQRAVAGMDEPEEGMHGEVDLCAAASAVAEALEVAAAAERDMEEALPQHATLRHSSRLRSHSAGAILRYHGGKAPADILAEARRGASSWESVL